MSAPCWRGVLTPVWLLLVCLCLGVPTGQAQVPARTPQMAPLADLRWRVETLDGVSHSLERFRGRVVVLNTWATWCEPCVAELQSFAALRAAVPDTTLVFAMVAAQRAEPVRAFVRRRGVTLPVYLETSPMPKSYGFDAVPTTWIIDRGGRVAFRHRGAMRWDTDAVRTLVTTLLAEAPPGDTAGNRTGQRP